MKLEGRNISEHPLAGRDDPDLDPKPYHLPNGDRVLATIATDFGSIETRGGAASFSPGDYIVSDDPPTHAWVIASWAFEAAYTPSGG